MAGARGTDRLPRLFYGVLGFSRLYWGLLMVEASGDTGRNTSNTGRHRKRPSNRTCMYLRVIEYMHRAGVVNCDTHPKNVLMKQHEGCGHRHEVMGR